MKNGRRSGRGVRRTGAGSKWVEPAASDPMTRFGKHVEPQPNGCWAFNGDLTKYGQFDRIAAHRWVWQALHGPILDNDHIHHECQNRGCVNPDHLARLSPADHAARHVELRRTA